MEEELEVAHVQHAYFAKKADGMDRFVLAVELLFQPQHPASCSASTYESTRPSTAKGKRRDYQGFDTLNDPKFLRRPRARKRGDVDIDNLKPAAGLALTAAFLMGA